MRDLAKFNENINVLVTGGSGQIGLDLQDIKLKKNYNFFFPDSNSFNLLNKEKMDIFFEKNKIDLIINLAAYTNVDQAEIDRELCKNINFKGVISLSELAKKNEVGIIQISTDYVFGKNNDGVKNIYHKPNPINYYGYTKFEPEKFIINESNNNLVIRLASVFGFYGNNFIKTMMKLILNNQDINVISDQKISMTSSFEFAKNIPYLIDLYKEKIEFTDRIIHFTNKGYTNWFEVTKVIKDELEKIINKKILININAIKSNDWTSIAKRPLDSRLEVNFKELENFNIFLPSWEMSVRDLVNKVFPEIIKDIRNEN